MFDNLLYDDVTTIKHHEKRTPQSFNFPTNNDAANENPTSNVLQFLAEGSFNESPTSNVFESFLGRDIYFSK